MGIVPWTPAERDTLRSSSLPEAVNVNKHRSWTPGLREANLLIYFVNLADNLIGADPDPTPNEFPRATSRHCGHLSWGPASVLIHTLRPLIRQVGPTRRLGAKASDDCEVMGVRGLKSSPPPSSAVCQSASKF
jgi:hypothetical protein